MRPCPIDFEGIQLDTGRIEKGTFGGAKPEFEEDGVKQTTYAVRWSKFTAIKIRLVEAKRR